MCVWVGTWIKDFHPVEKKLSKVSKQLFVVSRPDPLSDRVARWFLFKPKIPILVNFGGPWNAKCWNILWPFGIFNSHLVLLWPFGTFCGHLVYFSQFW
jgi:hypothetical protein